MKLLTCMSFAGTIPVMICFLLYIFQGVSYNYLFGRKLLITGMIFFLLPVQLVKYLIPEGAFSESMFNEDSQLYLSHSVNFWHEKQNEYIWTPQWFSAFICLWALMVFGFALFEFIRYQKGIRVIRNTIEFTIKDPEKNFTYYIVPDDVSGACTIGFFRQKIIMPEHLPYETDFEMVYKHEYAHLKNHDNLVKFLCLAVICLHWMNPAAYLLLYLYRETAEAVSDGAATEDCSKEKIKSYAMLLIEEATTPEILPVVWKNNLSGYKKQGKTMKIIKRRISYMMQKKKRGRLQKGIMLAVSALTVLASASTTLAYQPLQSSDMSVKNIVDSEIPEMMSFEMSYEDAFETDFSKSNLVFVTLDGEEIPVSDTASPHALCTHSMVNGYLKNHKSNGKGGCTVTVYTCQRCKKCGYLANAVYDSTRTYTKCPH